MANKKKVKAYVKKQRIPENKIIKELRSRYNNVNITSKYKAHLTVQLDGKLICNVIYR